MTDPNLTARVLLSIAALGCTAIPVIADFNRTHATNPLWTGHARFHVVWQVLSYVGIGLVIVYLIWERGGNREPLYLAASLVGAVYGGFFATYAAMPLFGGQAHDENGYLPIPLRLLGRSFHIDLNVTVFSIFVGLLLVGTLSIT